MYFNLSTIIGLLSLYSWLNTRRCMQWNKTFWSADPPDKLIWYFASIDVEWRFITKHTKILGGFTIAWKSHYLQSCLVFLLYLHGVKALEFGSCRMLWVGYGTMTFCLEFCLKGRNVVQLVMLSELRNEIFWIKLVLTVLRYYKCSYYDNSSSTINH